jgi:hypothetical protein
MKDVLDKSLDRLSDGLWMEAILDYRRGLYTSIHRLTQLLYLTNQTKSFHCEARVVNHRGYEWGRVQDALDR